MNLIIKISHHKKCDGKNYLQNKYNNRDMKTKQNVCTQKNNNNKKYNTKRRKFPIIYNLNICINIINLK